MPTVLKLSDLARPQFKANPYPFYARLRNESPVARSRFLGAPTWIITRYADVFSALKDERLVKDFPARTKWIHRLAGPVTRNMLNSDPPDHTRLRTLIHKAFTPSLVERLRERIEHVANELLEELDANGRMDLMKGFALPLPLTVIAELLGVPERDRTALHALTRSSLSASTVLGVLRALPDQRMLIRRFRQLIAARRAEQGDDLISALVQAEESGDKLSEEELVAMITLLLVAGYETTVNLIGTGALTLMENPEQCELFLNNPGITDTAIEELLRYTSPIDFATVRFANEDLSIASVAIARSQVVLLVLGSANRDETQFPNPDELDLKREPNRHLAFGQGVHFCVGAPLARLEGSIALLTLFRRFPTLRLAQPHESLRWRNSLLVRGLEGLPVKV